MAEHDCKTLKTIRGFLPCRIRIAFKTFLFNIGCWIKSLLLSNRTGDRRLNDSIFMEQTQPTDTIFRQKVNSVQASDLPTNAETQNFSLNWK